MAETAAHLVEHMLPQLPVRQWVVAFPRRLRYFLHRDPVLLRRVRCSVLRTIESGLRRRCPGAPHDSRFGAVSFVQRFGSALNAHTRLHCCVTDGVISVDAAGSLRFHPATGLTEATVSAVQRRIRSRVLRLAVRQGALTPDVAADLARWDHGGGFSVHAAVRIEAEDCAGQPVTDTVPVTVPVADPAPPAPTRRRASIRWARLLARIYELRPLTCPRCQGEMRLIAFLTEPASIRTLLAHLGEPATQPMLAPRARDPPELAAEGIGTAAFAFDQSPSWDPITPPPAPGFSFDQTLN